MCFSTAGDTSPVYAPLSSQKQSWAPSRMVGASRRSIVLAAVRERKSGIMKMSTLCDNAWGARGAQSLIYCAVVSKLKYILRETPTVLLGAWPPMTSIDMRIQFRNGQLSYLPELS